MSGFWHPQDFPDLPVRDYWRADILQAHEIIQESCQHALEVLRQEDGGDPLRLRIHADHIHYQMIPLFEVLQNEVEDMEWAEECAHKLGKLFCALSDAALAAADRDQSTAELFHVAPVQRRLPGPDRGCPSFEFDKEWLANAVSATRHISLQTLARILGVHRNTLRRHLQINGLAKRFSDISDAEIDVLIRHYKLQRPNAGLRFVLASLKSHGLNIQRERVRMSMQRIDPLGRIICHQTAIRRRVYEAPQSNYVWHIDGHHKLIRWGIVIHGMIDGYCRTVVGLRASADNRASTVLNLFLHAVQIYRTPWRVRGDRGGENIEVATWMIQHRGPNRSSFLWGRSTRNCRIERLWVDLGTQFVRCWRAFFTRLEDLHMLDSSDPRHLWLLHFIFFDQLNVDCEQFQNDWNHHLVSKRGQNQSPLDMQLLSQIQHGEYIECHEHHLNNFGPITDPDIMTDQQRHVRNAAASVPPTANPFQSIEAYQAFTLAFQQARNQGNIPTGYGVAEEEWVDGLYPEREVITVGRSKREHEVGMPFVIWWPRAVLWAKGLDIMTRVCMIESGDL